jgi:hypothetical protein
LGKSITLVFIKEKLGFAHNSGVDKTSLSTIHEWGKPFCPLKPVKPFCYESHKVAQNLPETLFCVLQTIMTSDYL